jgi:hypothetical protein
VPFLRVIRDKRGYETTYLMHWYREGNRQHSRILYLFRSPGGVRVGRDPLEPEVLRLIESQHPDISFDWRVVRDNQQIVEVSQEPRRRRTPRQEEGEVAAAPVKVAEAPAPPPARPSVPAKIEGETPDEQIAFLAQLYPVLRERIHQRIADPGRQEALLALAERLNPAAWTDADQLTTGLEQAAEALERLSHVFAKRRRRGRKKPRTGPEAAGEPAPTESGADSADGESESEPESEEGPPL